VPTHEVDFAGEVKIVDLLAAAGLAPSKSAARRLVEQGGVKVGDRKVAGVDELLKRDEVGADGVLLHAGKKHLKRIIAKG
jgi:tyrosyl-tRNA synthetase